MASGLRLYEKQMFLKRCISNGSEVGLNCVRRQLQLHNTPVSVGFFRAYN